jgi:mannose-1-phosphate guanylyltransferase / mannose-6-phosphate isomerase
MNIVSTPTRRSGFALHPAITVHPVLLCGGSGTRLWPLSRQSFPKQFAAIAGTDTLFQAAARRFDAAGFAAPVIVTGADFRFIVREQLAALDLAPGAILVEPEARNTGPAVLAAALLLARDDAEAVMLAAPSDQLIDDAPAFRQAVDRGLAAVLAHRIVTFGISPLRPEPGFGYLELAQSVGSEPGPVPLAGFVEKPDAARAAGMLAEGRFLWNSGIVLCRAADLIDAYRRLDPSTVAAVEAALAAAAADLGFLRVAAGPWAGTEALSLDRAVMERAGNLSVVAYHGGWSDLGSWEAVGRAIGQSDGAAACNGAATAIDCRDSLLWSTSPGLELVGIGLDGIIAVATPDAVLVLDKSRSQDAGQAVAALKARGAVQATASPRDHRPWGWFETLALADRFQVKRIVVNPGGTLSLQSHHHRSEHWIVVQGTARVTIGETVSLVTENQSVYVPLGVKHRMQNPGKLPMVLIEVQTGPYLGEDDIERFEDVYARGQGAKG